MQEEIKKLLDKACEAYDKGIPFMSDDVFDELARIYGYEEYAPTEYLSKGTHKYPMYSLQKVFDEDSIPSTIEGKDTIESMKLDGAACSLLYIDGYLVQGLTRGDGNIGEDITDKVYHLVPSYIPYNGQIQISGEITATKDISNSRNYTAGALHLKDIEEFKSRVLDGNMVFVAYNVYPFLDFVYLVDMLKLKQARFHTILDKAFLKDYPSDGKVFRINDNEIYNDLGFTAKHPRGSYSRKQKSSSEIKETMLKDVVWQVGGSGKVTPVAIFNEIILNDAKVSRATLHNKRFIEEMDLDIGDTILVTRSGQVIPKVLGKV